MRADPKYAYLKLFLSETVGDIGRLQVAVILLVFMSTERGK